MRHFIWCLLLLGLGCKQSDHSISLPGRQAIEIGTPVQMQPVKQIPLSGSKDGKLYACIEPNLDTPKTLHVREWNGKEIFTKSITEHEPLPVLFSEDNQKVICIGDNDSIHELDLSSGATRKLGKCRVKTNGWNNDHT